MVTNNLPAVRFIQAFCFSFADEEIFSGQRLRSTRLYIFWRAAEIEVTVTFETPLLKVLRTDVTLARFGQICPFNTHLPLLKKWLIF